MSVSKTIWIIFFIIFVAFVLLVWLASQTLIHTG